MRTIAGLFFVGLIMVAPAASAAKDDVDWKKCPQPDLTSAAFKSAVDKRYRSFVDDAKETLPNMHVSVQLNRFYPTVVKARRKQVADAYIEPSKRVSGECAVTPANYTAILASRDAAYRLLCRSEVAVSTNSASRAASKAQALIWATTYDAWKTFLDVRQSDDPTTPAGGAAACSDGADEGLEDTVPTAAQVATFKSHMSGCDVAKVIQTGASEEIKDAVAKYGFCVDDGE